MFLHPSMNCAICYSSDIPLLIPCNQCGMNFCYECFSIYCKYKVIAGEVSKTTLTCPGIKCTRSLQQDEIKNYLTKDQFQKYMYYLEEKKIGLRFCPQPYCGKKVEEKPKTKCRKIKCHTCKKISCNRCGKEYHTFPFCRKNDEVNVKWKRYHDIRCCPHCHWEIEKNGGCAHMTCTRCEHEFCWFCKQSWKKHRRWMCIPWTLYYCNHRNFGPNKPVRIITKFLTAVASISVIAALSGIAIIVLPSICMYDGAIKLRNYLNKKKRLKRHQHIMMTM